MLINDQMPIVIHNREAAEGISVLFLDSKNLADLHVLLEHDGVQDKSMQVLLDPLSLLRLACRCQILVDYANASQFCHLNCHGVLGNGIHRSADKRRIKGYVSGEAGVRDRLPWQEIRIYSLH